MPSPTTDLSPCLSLSLSFSVSFLFTLVLHPLQRDRESIIGCGSENEVGDPVGRS